MTATPGDGSATVTFNAPADQGGGITTYTVTSYPGGHSAQGHASPITVTGLTNGTAYTFTVTAANAAGAGPSSSPSVPVTPLSPTHVRLTAPPLATYGKPMALAGTVVRTDNNSPYGTVTLKRYVGDGAHVVRTMHTSDHGRFRFRVRPSTTAAYAVVYHGDSLNRSARSAKRKVAVALRIAAWGWRVWRGHSHVVVMGQVNPAAAGHTARLYELFSGRMHRVASARISRTGSFRIRANLPRGSYTLQVGLRRTAHHAASFSKLIDLPHDTPASTFYGPGERRLPPA